MIGQKDFIQRIVDRLKTAYDNYDGAFEIVGTDVDSTLTNINQFDNDEVRKAINYYCYDYTPKGDNTNTWIFSKIRGKSWPEAPVLRDGQKVLFDLSNEVKAKIASKFNSVPDFYMLVYALGEKYHKAFMSHDTQATNQYEKLMYNIGDILESFGVNDGFEVCNEIIGDYDEAYFKAHYRPLTTEEIQFLRSFGIEPYVPIK